MKKLKIALLGLGTVGSGVWNILKANRGEIEKATGITIEVARILVRDKFKKRSVTVPPGILTTDFSEILADGEIKIVVEVMGGIDPTREYIIKALERGKHVVTANKLLISKYGKEIADRAKNKRVNLSYEASVCGGIPIINTIQQSLSVEKITGIVGIINGTTNYILSQMSETSCSFEAALRQAQAQGYAEADPVSDVEGYDALYKLRILSRLAYGVDINENCIYREGITKITPEDIAYARELGYNIKLLVVAKLVETAVDIRVHPALVPLSHSLAGVMDAFNAVWIRGEAVGDLMFYGRGAGELPTGSAVVNDIVSILRNNHEGRDRGRNTEDKNPVQVVNIKDIKTSYYLRLNILSGQEVENEITGAFAANRVNIARYIRKCTEQELSTILLLTREAVENNVQNAIKQMKSNLTNIQSINLIRIENLGH